MADTLGQSLSIERGDDISIVLTGTFSEDPTGWSMQFSVAKQRGQTPVLTVTTPSIVIAGSAGTYTCTIPVTRAQSSLLLLDGFDWDLHRTNSGSVSVKAGGTLQVLTPVYPPVSS
jgi:hypothetical protein